MILKPGSIVIVDMHDAFVGHVVAPAIIRYWDSENKVYEANVFIPSGSPERCMGVSNTHWWPISPKDIKMWVGSVVVEKECIGPERSE